MHYFEIFDLRLEPFSNSPDPEFFYQAQSHRECLNSLEIALRLKRGLNVVLGEVGAGKSTLCRQLVRTLAQDDDFETHLFLDPYFDSPAEFLAVLCRSLTGAAPAEGEGEWQVKERIKNALLDRAVERGRHVVVLLDEGQKIPPLCLEILRELLNFETNDSKLLQIVIFAQKEFAAVIASLPNFADRINERIELGPLSFSETRAMVRHRLATASKTGHAPELFTPAGYLALHLASGGHPRKIVSLGHKIMLGLIVKNRTRAGWRQVTAAARQRGLTPWRARLGGYAAGAATLAVLAVLGWQMLQTPESGGEVASKPATETVAPVSQDAPAPPERPAIAPEAKQPPQMLGSVPLSAGESVSELIVNVYGRFTPELLRKVAAANPDIADVNSVARGRRVAMPLPEAVEAGGEWWLVAGEADELAAAYLKLRTLRLPGLKVRLLPLFDERTGLRFAVAAFPSSRSEDAAQVRLASLGPDGSRFELKRFAAPVRYYTEAVLEPVPAQGDG